MKLPSVLSRGDRCRANFERVQRSLRLLTGALAVLLIALPLRSQINTGRISGAITDQSGGAISGAKVTVIEVATNVARALTTDSSGQYAAPNLLPGIYRVQVEYAGFESVDRQNVEVGAGGDVRVDVSLRPGQQNQTLTVTESIPMVNTTNAQTGGTLETAVIEEIPLNGRNYRWLVEYVPGVMTSPGEGTASSSTNGGGTDWVNFMIDGLYDESPFSKQSTVGGAGEAGDTTLLPLDAIQEMALVTNPKAEYGLDPGLTENIALKSGTNNMHGSAYAFGRNQALDARNGFATLGKQPVEFEQWGATFGGPVKKDKMFFFGGYEGERLNVTSDYQVAGDATTASGLGTTFSIPDAIAAMNSLAAPVAPSPLSLNLAGCNPANPNINSKVGATVALACTANQFGAPGLFNNTANSSTVAYNLPQYGGSDNGLAKIDYHINEHHTVNGSYFFGQYHEYADASNVITQPYWDEVLGVRSQLVRGVEVWTPNSRWLNEVRIGWDHDSRPVVSAECSVNGAVTDPLGLSSPAGQFGGPNYVTSYGLVSGSNACGIPTIKFASGVTAVLGFGNNRSNFEGSFQVADNVSYTRGKHQFKFGVDIRVLNFNGTKVQDSQRGTITFGTSGLAAFSGATALESFLAGDPSAETIKVGNPIRTIRWDEIALFAQDDWRVLPRLTLNLGLRWEAETPAHDDDELLGNFDPTQPSGMIQGNALWPTQSDYEPHVGFAWDIFGTGRTTLRSGIGVATATPQLQNWITSQFVDMSAVPTGATLYFAKGATIKGPGTIDNILEALAPFGNGSIVTGNKLPWGSGTPLFNAKFFGCGNGLPVTGNPALFNPQPCTGYAADPNIKFPEMATWNLNIQHAFTNNLSLDVGYIGSHAWDITAESDLNEPTLGASGSSEQTRRPYAGPFPWFSQILSLVDAGSSNYAALQASLNQRVSHGLNYSLGYTYSHGVGLQGGVGTGNGVLLNGACPHCEYGDLNFDIRHHFSLTATYQLPGRQSPAQLLQGWALNSSVNVLSALPLNALDSSRDTSGTGEKIDRWTLYGDRTPFDDILGGPGTVPCYGIAGSQFSKSANCTIVPNAAGFPAPCIAAAAAEPNGPAGVANNTGPAQLSAIGCYALGNSAIVPPAQGTFGSMSRNALRAKGFEGWNASVTKDWKIKERLTAQFRWEAFNLLNRTQYAGIGANLGNPGSFGEATQTPDVAKSNPVVGSGGPREMQVGLKLIF